jgi:hypothetical protein
MIADRAAVSVDRLIMRAGTLCESMRDLWRCARIALSDGNSRVVKSLNLRKMRLRVLLIVWRTLNINGDCIARGKCLFQRLIEKLI